MVYLFACLLITKEDRKMFMCLNRNWEAIDATAGNHQDTIIPIGWYEIEKIKNPFGFKGYWLVIKGTLIGASEGSWLQCNDEDKTGWGRRDFQVVITDTLPEGVMLSTL
ncbi:MAG: hypothetical protein V1716_02180 [Candidatus Uhrbacteria bacterium]